MMWEDLLDDAKEEGRQEGLQEGHQVMVSTLKKVLDRLGVLPDEVAHRIDQEKDMDKISAWIELAAKAESLEDFIDHM